MLNWIIWNRTVFDIKTVFTLNWIVTYNCLNSLKWKCFWQLNSVLMLNWIVLNRTDYLHKMDLALNNLQSLICHKTQQTNQPTNHGYLWLSLTIPFYPPSLPASLLDYILCPYRTLIDKFWLIGQHLHIHVKGFIGVHHLWVHSYISSSVPHVLSILFGWF